MGERSVSRRGGVTGGGCVNDGVNGGGSSGVNGGGSVVTGGGGDDDGIA